MSLQRRKNRVGEQNAELMAIQTANGLFVSVNTTASDIPDPLGAALALQTKELSPTS
jgi:hypothetical protein